MRAITTFPKPRTFLARPLIALTLALQLAHVLVVTLFPHPVLTSNLLQLAFPLLVVGISAYQGSFSTNSVGRRCWRYTAIAFGIWSLAQILFIYFLYFPPRSSLTLRPDDALWVLFGFPLLLAVNTNHDEVDRVAWLDRMQALVFIVVLYLLVFLPSAHLNLSRAFVVQDMALLLCCVLRLPICILARERRFFIRLGCFFLIYGPMTILGDLLHAHGWGRGSLVDLAWTLPSCCFILLILRDALRSQEKEGRSGRFVTAIRSMQGLSVATLTSVSIGLAALLAVHNPWLGGISLVCSFAIFALRTNARERAWHLTHGQLTETVLQDALTGLGNRTLLRNSLDERLSDEEKQSSTVLLFADLDRFKNINDSLGHALGDQLLIQVAERLRAAAPAGSVVCRLGGDEFVILTTAPCAAAAEAQGAAVLDALRPAYHLSGHILRCTASIGVVLSAPGEAADDLLRLADHAMYRAKQLGKNCVQVFDTTLRTQMSSRWEMEADLRTCLEQGGIDVAFQPILSVGGGEIAGFEALARWTHPTRGIITPAEFIPIAEESGLILLLGAQILDKACAQVAAWNRAWQKSLSLSVNVSPRQFADAQLLPKILETLQRTGLAPALLQLEITESTLLVHEGMVKQTLLQAREHGIRISLDDFGTGYSSLAFLLSLPVDEVKVDRSFVSDMHRDEDRRVLVQTVVQLGQSLGKRVVAEGVETEQHLRALAAMGCECAQGWLISRPLSAENIELEMPSIEARNLSTALHMQNSLSAHDATPGPLRGRGAIRREIAALQPAAWSEAPA